MQPIALHFDWSSFTAALSTHPPITSPGLVWVYVAKVDGTKEKTPTLVFRVWYHSIRGMVAYVGDRSTGPQSATSLALAEVIQAGLWATSAGMTMQWAGAWADDWDEVQP